LAVGQGDLVVVAGRSGSGKTTLLGIAAGLVEPSSGHVLWQGARVADLSADARARRRGSLIGIVFQNAALIETLTAAENVLVAAVPAGVRREDGRRARELLGEQGLGARRDHDPSRLSGGERQRVALARALFADPPLLIVDEPTANLDRVTADGLIETLVRLAAAGRGLLVASHDRHLIDRATGLIRLEPEALPGD
ncbi:MAG: ABC transporter ATP-binding protein, partial [Candidatus Limnocylindrales bacterium]